MNFNTEKPIYLQIVDVISDGIIYNKRGIGYFVSDDARDTVLNAQRKDFIEKEVPAIKQRMTLLGLDSSIFNE